MPALGGQNRYLAMTVRTNPQPNEKYNHMFAMPSFTFLPLNPPPALRPPTTGAGLLSFEAESSPAFAFVAALGVWWCLAKTLGARVSAEHEAEGLDQAECGVDAYATEFPRGMPRPGTPTEYIAA